jgi:sugar phosphate permease
MLSLLTFILYLDRICISQAATKIRESLDLSNFEMGWVISSFTIAYGLFEVPTGHWGDRYGSRGVLTRIVLWWSLFTVLTGAATGFVMIVVVRFLFGAGEAGALPNAVRVVKSWFPAATRGSANGVVITSMLVGGAAAPVITHQLIDHLGWRWAFAMLGLPGIVWAIVFYAWFRDDPADHPAVNEAERWYIAGGDVPSGHAKEHPAVPWRLVLTSANVWLLGVVVTCAAFTTYLFFMWYPTYLKDGRSVSERDAGWCASLVLSGGAAGSILGGRLSDWLIRRTGNRRWSRRAVGLTCLSSAAACMVGSIFCDSYWLAAALAACACTAIHMQAASWWGAVTDISGKHLGALFGLMNSLGVPGAAASPLFLGWFVDRLGGMGYTGRDQWDPAFYVYGALLMIGAVCWLFIDVTKSAVEDL